MSWEFGPNLRGKRLTLDGVVRVAAGNLHETVNINGSQVVNVPGFAAVSQSGGVYALGTNIGTHAANNWVVFPEVGAGVSWRITSNLQLRVGYDVLFLNGVARAADQVNTTINPQRLPGRHAAGGHRRAAGVQSDPH